MILYRPIGLNNDYLVLVIDVCMGNKGVLRSRDQNATSRAPSVPTLSQNDV